MLLGGYDTTTRQYILRTTFYILRTTLRIPATGCMPYPHDILKRMMQRKKEVLIWAMLAVGLVAIVFGIYGAVVQSGRSTGSLIAPVTADDRTRGNDDAAVTIVEYSDFQCPACKYFYGIMSRLEEEKGGTVRVVFRHFPLPQHVRARLAALAAEAAGAQGKFWEMHDLLFERQDEWSSDGYAETMVGYAGMIGLDTDRFMADMQRQELAAKIDRDIATGKKQDIVGTPTFYLNGSQIQFRSYEELKQLVEEEFNK